MQTIMLTDGTRYNVLEIREKQKMNHELNQRKNTATFVITDPILTQEIREKFADPILTQEIRNFFKTGEEMPNVYRNYTKLLGVYDNVEQSTVDVTMMESSTIEDKLRENEIALEATQAELQEIKAAIEIIAGGEG